jgi:hypothetical protein
MNQDKSLCHERARIYLTILGITLSPASRIILFIHDLAFHGSHHCEEHDFSWNSVRVYSTLTYILVNYDTVAKVWTNATY